MRGHFWTACITGVSYGTEFAEEHLPVCRKTCVCGRARVNEKGPSNFTKPSRVGNIKMRIVQAERQPYGQVRSVEGGAGSPPRAAVATGGTEQFFFRLVSFAVGESPIVRISEPNRYI